MSKDNDFEDYNYCYECTGYGDDYYVDDNGELVSACDDCIHNPCAEDPWDE